MSSHRRAPQRGAVYTGNARRYVMSATKAELDELPIIIPAGMYDLAQIERMVIARALMAARGHRQRAASMLGVNRTTLFNKITKLGIPAPQYNRAM